MPARNVIAGPSAGSHTIGIPELLRDCPSLPEAVPGAWDGDPWLPEAPWLAPLMTALLAPAVWGLGCVPGLVSRSQILWDLC